MPATIKVIELSASEKRLNESMLDEALVKASSIVDGVRQSQIDSVKREFKKFIIDNNVLLINLIESEQQALHQMLVDALSKKAINEDERRQWVGGLKHAVQGRVDTELQTIHATISTMADDLIRTGGVPHAKWGTDLDVTHVLGTAITFKPEDNIKQQGHYILPPISLTESKVVLADYIGESLKAVNKNNITGPVSLSIPANCGNNHWRLVKMQIENKAVVSATLWDSLGGDAKALETSVPYVNLQSTVHEFSPSAKVNVKLAQTQRNGYSCMDYSVQEALREAKVDNEITQAADSGQLRLAVVKQIAEHVPALKDAGFSKVLTLSDVGEAPQSSVSAPKHPVVIHDVSEVEAKQVMAEFTQNKKKQIEFDREFSKKLQELYNENPTVDEKQLEKKAFAYAYRTCGLFDQKSVADQVASSDASLSKITRKPPTG